MTVAAGHVFELLTGKQPARVYRPATGSPGIFEIFLRDLFVVMSVKASAAHCVRSHMEEIRSGQPIQA